MKQKSQKNSINVPEPTLKRIPRYYNLLQDYKTEGTKYVSAPSIAKHLGLDPTQVFKDLSYTGITGKTRVGFNIDALIAAIEKFLGFDVKDKAFLVGAGKIGSALINYEGLKKFGVEIVAAFDTDEKLIEKNVLGIKVHHINKFRDIAANSGVIFGIITTPSKVAQQVADMMVGWGIKAIWNFAPVNIKVPDNIIVQDTSMYSNLAVVLHKLHNIKEDCE